MYLKFGTYKNNVVIPHQSAISNGIYKNNTVLKSIN